MAAVHISVVFAPCFMLKENEFCAATAEQVLYYDGQFDDARMNVALACTAATAGATTLNHFECQSLIKAGDTALGVLDRGLLEASHMLIDVHLCHKYMSSSLLLLSSERVWEGDWCDMS